MEVVLPKLDGAPQTWIKAEMEVLRIDHEIPGKRRSGFSAISKGFSLRTNSKKLSDPIKDSMKEKKGPGISHDE